MLITNKLKRPIKEKKINFVYLRSKSFFFKLQDVGSVDIGINVLFVVIKNVK